MMRHRYLGSITVLAALAATVASSPKLSAGQQAPKPVVATAAAVGRDTTPRTPWGDPDLQGIWTNTTTTPFERPTELAGKQALTPEERAERDAVIARSGDRPAKPGDTGAYNKFWGEAGKTSAQTSLIVDPPDGKLPAVTQQAKNRADAIEARRRVP